MMLQNKGKIENILFFCHCKTSLCIAGNIISDTDCKGLNRGSNIGHG
jgi:hypothetical protein